MERRKFSEDECRDLRKHPGIRIAAPCAVVITDALYQRICRSWRKGQFSEVIAQELRINKLDILGEQYVDALSWGLDRYERRNISRKDISVRTEEIALIASGCFYPRGEQVAWNPEFKEALLETYPEKSFEERLEEEGMPLEVIGKQRISALRQYYLAQRHEKTTAGKSEESSDAEDLRVKSKELGAYVYHRHPYVESVERANRLTLSEAFYNETMILKDHTINDLLAMYEIDPSLICNPCLEEIWETFISWEKTETTCRVVTDQTIRIQMNRLKVLEKRSEELFSEIRNGSRGFRPLEKKKLYRQIAEYPTKEIYPYGYSLREILSRIGVSKTTYYTALNKSGYGMADLRRRQKDEEDLAVIMEVVEYKGFEKGVRQIYMMMPQITGKRFALSKIRRLLRKAGIKTKVRGENPARQRVTAFHLRNTKPDLLKRRFRLSRPNEVRLTDVTYLDYRTGDDRLRAYGSSCIDPVTGKLLAFHASESNDLPLAMETLARLRECPAVEGALLHSDQGILYLTDEFQREVAAMGMSQSMSKRGNCWDNAPQESFFGHFKDECHYEDCESFEQLQQLLDEYAYYYNHERHQWGRRQMTPIQYEEWMEGLSDEEFEEYLRSEQARYDSMKEKAEEKAIARAKTLGV